MNSRLTLKPKLIKKTIVADEKVEVNDCIGAKFITSDQLNFLKNRRAGCVSSQVRTRSILKKP